MNSALLINNLSCQYEDQVILESLSLEVESGQIVCLLGASGCGKTTLLKAIAGLLPLSSGEMHLNGRLIDNGRHWVPPEQRNIGMIFQDYALFPHLTVAENVAFGLRGLERDKVQEKVAEMLELVHLGTFAERYPHQLSGGQQQRVAIARSLAYKPDLLLLDEPFSNIDTQVRHELIIEIRKLFKAQGVTAIFVTHSREEAFAFADKMAVMNRGVIEQIGTASELYYRPTSRFVADFLGGGRYLPARRVDAAHYQTHFGMLKALAQRPIQQDQACDLLLRPQHVHIQPDPSSSIVVLEQQFMGDHCRYLIDVEGLTLLATATTEIAIGQPVAVTIDQQGLLAF
ncbi:ATP-binding cassette domain-containing protein [Vibrio sp. V27_P1S3P104]|uniref:ABC transporter ATP-binding protein n=2 Tax=Vibrio TaxID=662 RepID=UPI0013734E8E|nr:MULTISPECIES: ABC transporter ATP-binding protein [unclassified Vibrio]NAW68984.1 ATP-binding cassette domain-containing protein [Vibrio sp. V28_P6S34P95]NAX04239.1 ATP-binding cassette domain-containing protein [Vibrio sp. V30_P3S12P165]NAX34419.1 ATP-binding cassette domain-containing protein [Vibrio sp. V29_P1S30P107]NAX38838.1 ATP-binding cassette domain-containing protein [Vibrio sp. V27_P1S3P104]NAX39354.1 ATP-binding cassette domain-containing protein [Vibrio sp. V26_P1S5P106]